MTESSSSSCSSTLCLIFGRPFVKRFALCYWTIVLSCLSVCLSVCDVRALWPNGWTDQDETWHAGRPRPWQHCVRWGPSSPPPKGHSPPIFGPCLLRPNGWMMKLVLGMEVDLSPGDFVLDVDPVPFPQKRGGAPSPIFGPFYCCQMAQCIKMPLDMDVGLSPGDFVLDGDPVFPPQQRGRRPPNFRPISIVPKRLDASRCHSLWR